MPRALLRLELRAAQLWAFLGATATHPGFREWQERTAASLCAITKSLASDDVSELEHEIVQRWSDLATLRERHRAYAETFPAELQQLEAEEPSYHESAKLERDLAAAEKKRGQASFERGFGLLWFPLILAVLLGIGGFASSIACTVSKDLKPWEGANPWTAFPGGALVGVIVGVIVAVVRGQRAVDAADRAVASARASLDAAKRESESRHVRREELLARARQAVEHAREMGMPSLGTPGSPLARLLEEAFRGRPS